MRFDALGLEVLRREDCLALLATVPLGRVIFTDRALPAIQPVNFVLDGADVILCAASGSKLEAALRSSVVAFEADAFDPIDHSGWSVTLVGHASLVHNPVELDRLSRLPLEVWTPGPHDRYVRIRGNRISGRRIRSNAA